ncbi:MAG: hypothetical protein DME00_34650 [Candidatus Rokuibacteriota bacterium]|nr:MAG: hypothetical protein DME00_34650 [Candidatus Rokubacteria bacterium]
MGQPKSRPRFAPSTATISSKRLTAAGELFFQAMRPRLAALGSRRDAVVIALNTGLRLGELLGLNWIYVDLSRGVIRLEFTKSGRRREMPLNGDSHQALVSLTPKAEGRVFQTRFIKTAYNAAVAIAKLDDVNFHTLRHTFASWAVMRGVSLKELQELLGHSSLAMMMRYAHLAPEHLRAAVSRLEGLTNSQRAEMPTQE